MGWEVIAMVTAAVLFGLLVFSVDSSARRERREEAERQKFYKAVEEARQKQIEGAKLDLSISGVWKGEGTGFFGVGRRLEFRFNHSGSTVSGQLKDDYGEAMLSGYFVCPYIMFDVRRDDTSFEFRGTLEDLGGTRTIRGKYRYSTTDADWLVKEISGSPAVTADKSAGSAKSAIIAEQKPQAAAERKWQEAIEPELVDSSKQESKPKAEEKAKTAISTVPEPDMVPDDPSGDAALPDVQDGSNECPTCRGPLDANFEFCLYCGQAG